MHVRFLIKTCIIFVLGAKNIHAQSIPKLYLENKTFTYPELIQHYKNLDDKYSECKLLTYGKTDVGKPLHLFVMNSKEDFDPKNIQAEGKGVLLIMNGIHPGEPDGIDASLVLAEEFMLNNDLKKILNKIVICIIPVYNVDGMLNRSCCSRANQNGPEQYGFRGNGRNLDLNRDFIKCDSQNAMSFLDIYQAWKPQIFIDTHVSNGADYQYTFTLLATQKDKLAKPVAEYMTEKMVPKLYEEMAKTGFDAVPYVNTFNHLPDSGISTFYDSPRFSSGYASLFNCFAFVSETHMLKAYPQRVENTKFFLEKTARYFFENKNEIMEAKKAADLSCANDKGFYMNYNLDKSRWSDLAFYGYEPDYKPSDVTRAWRLYFDQSRPYQRNIRNYEHYVGTDFVNKPKAYILPQAWHEVADRLKKNGIKLEPIKKDSLAEVEFYYLQDIKTSEQPYEGHYFHQEVKTEIAKGKIQLFEGDFIIKTGQISDKFLMSVLEPIARDSYFRWGFFDSVIQQKEGYSDYVFEETAAEILKNNPELKRKLQEKKATDPKFAGSTEAQLNFVYQNSPYYEKSHNRYPVYRVM